MGFPKEKEKKLKKAVALQYISGRDRAPKVTAKGQGAVARKIIELAQENGVPIHTDPALIQILAQLDFYEEIPPEAYLVVAEILAFVYKVNQTWHQATARMG